RALVVVFMLFVVYFGRRYIGCRYKGRRYSLNIQIFFAHINYFIAFWALFDEVSRKIVILQTQLTC
ncbi:MAG: hypothetical protein IIV28_03365, partial [Alistipes sp.]|nr:hypothetical protein [Alistipes sp.]